MSKDPFSRGLIYNQIKNELAEAQLDFEKAKLIESKQLTSNEVSRNFSFRLVEIVSNSGECSILFENHDALKWVEVGNTL